MKWVILAIAVLSTLPTAAMLRDARNRCGRLDLSGENGLFKLDCEHVRRREWQRVLKSALLLLGLVMGLWDLQPPVPWLDRTDVRNGIALTVILLLSWTSVLERKHTLAMEAGLREREHGALRVPKLKDEPS